MDVHFTGIVTSELSAYRDTDGRLLFTSSQLQLELYPPAPDEWIGIWNNLALHFDRTLDPEQFLWGSTAASADAITMASDPKCGLPEAIRLVQRHLEQVNNTYAAMHAQGSQAAATVAELLRATPPGTTA